VELTELKLTKVGICQESKQSEMMKKKGNARGWFILICHGI
jgi:hypothetical protein